MASVRKSRGKWQAQVRRKGFKTLSRTFETKGAASAWARAAERELECSEHPEAPAVLRQTTLGDLLDRYRDTVTPLKKSRRQETYRLNFLIRQAVSRLPLAALTTGVFARYRDERLRQVGPQMVLHELNALSVVLKTTKLDWDVPLSRLYIDEIRKPRMPPGRERRLRDDELERLEKACLEAQSPYLWPLIEFALETAMRKSEVLGLEWRYIRWKERLAFLPETKNGRSRDVPLTAAAVGILVSQRNKRLSSPFPYSVAAVRHAWDRATKKAGISDLRFHDLRHEAISRFLEAGLSVAEVANISGHTDFRMLARYTHLDGRRVVASLSDKGL